MEVDTPIYYSQLTFMHVTKGVEAVYRLIRKSYLRISQNLPTPST